jgi:hypothetical protein
MLRKFIYLWIMIITLLALTGCSSASTTEEITDLSVVVARTQTAIAVSNLTTVVVEPTLTSLPPTATSTEAPAVPTNTPSPEPTASHTPTPTSPPQPADCTNKAKFEEETIPDNTSFSANKEFIKTWTLRNTGTCTWTPDYLLAFSSGDRLGSAVTAPIGITVAPNDTVELSVKLIAPAVSGTYQADFILRTPSGKDFGLGSNADKTFWVKIRVVETTSELNLGAPTWSDNFDSDSGFWPLGDDAQLGYKLANSDLVMTSFQKIGDQWRLNNNLPASNLALEVKFETGEQCSGKDSYGVIVRSTETGDDIYDSGYVFVFSCDGMYRLYRMDNGNFISLLNWTASSDINAGPKQTNTLTILLDDTLIRLYANGNRLAQVNDSGHTQGKWGLSVRSVDTSNFAISVKEVSYWVLSDG